MPFDYAQDDAGDDVSLASKLTYDLHMSVLLEKKVLGIRASNAIFPLREYFGLN